MGLKSLVSRVIPTAVGFVTGGPIGATTALMATEKAKRQEREIKRQNELYLQEYQQMMDFGMGRGSTFSDPYASNLVVNRPLNGSGGGGFFDTLRGGIRDVGNLVGDVFSTGIPDILGFNRPPSTRTQPAITTVTNVGASETSGSGTIDAGLGGMVPNLIGLGKNLLRSPLGGALVGGAVGSGLGLIGPDGKPMRVTRKMKSQARMILNMTGGDLNAASQILGVDQQILVQILLKRFRNDGPVVTKAALRKTKQTVRRLKSMCDMYDSLRPSATRRRAPMKRASTTLISNK